MPDSSHALVTNTTPLITITAATGSLDALRVLYGRVVVPREVADEIHAGGPDAFGIDVFQQSSWLEIIPRPLQLWPYLMNTLDKGEASVIQTAMQLGSVAQID
jgi:predicted nucleic acid-binding protein